MRRSILLLILFVTSIDFAKAQDFAALLNKKFESYREKYLNEKIYVATDREFYLTGEMIWFKMYSVDGSFHKLLNVSKVAYIELLNRNNEPVAQAKIEVINGLGIGSFFLPASLASDNYLLRAYTNWMKNAGPDFYFSKIIAIVNPFVRMEQQATNKPPLHVDFYPEGGALLNGISTRIAIKLSAVSHELPGASVVILNERNDTLKRMHPKLDGVGSFEFTPDINTKYKVYIKSKDRISWQDFVPVQSSGYAFRLVDEGDHLQALVTRIDEGRNTDSNLTFFAHNRNIISKIETKRIENKQVSFIINTTDLPEGISHFTVFDEKGSPVCQRLYFKKPQSIFSKIKVSADRTGIRSKNSLHINPLDNSSIVSVSITRIDSLSAGSSTLIDYLSIQSDLGIAPLSTKWQEASPQETDNLMLTQSWRRFSWQDILKGNVQAKYLPESRGHVIQAVVTNTHGEVQKDEIIYISAPEKNPSTCNAKSDENGKVTFEVSNLYGARKLYFQTNRLTDSTSIVKIESAFSDQFASWPLPDLQLTSPDEKRILDRSVHMQVQNIFFDEYENVFNAPKIDSIPFYGKAEEIYKLDEYTRFPLMEEVMREYVPGVVVRKKKDGFNFYVLDKKHNSLFREPPLILLDGVPIFDADEIMQFDPLKVKQLDVVTSKYFHGNLELPGIVSYHTYTGDLAGFQVRSKNSVVEYEGLQIQRKFYSPSYSSSSSTESRMPDPRYLLYWNPDVKIQGEEKKEIEFYTSDVPGTYLVKVEGITSTGKVIQGSATFVVTDR